MVSAPRPFDCVDNLDGTRWLAAVKSMRHTVAVCFRWLAALHICRAGGLLRTKAEKRPRDSEGGRGLLNVSVKKSTLSNP